MDGIIVVQHSAVEHVVNAGQNAPRSLTSHPLASMTSNAGQNTTRSSTARCRGFGQIQNGLLTAEQD